ncbi:vitellogenin-like [Carassius gibelio]|uniref:vitellogenin-like n=1 Tax=Carassius gibelio TaxID=101364 RepID=UPI0022789707|nr:vitellogenin-like [Carassius gibelio]
MRAVVLALTVAIVASQQINLVPDFPLYKTYVYKYEALQERIIQDIGLAYTERCAECTYEVKSLIETASYNYIMKPAATGVLIAEETVEEVHYFSPIHEIHDAAMMEAKNTLAFVEIEMAPIVPIKADYLARGSLQYEFVTEIL